MEQKELDPLSAAAIARRKIGDQSRSRIRAAMAVQLPSGFELCAVFKLSALKVFGHTFDFSAAQLSLLDDKEDIDWFHVKISDDRFHVGVPSETSSFPCTNCHTLMEKASSLSRVYICFDSPVGTFTFPIALPFCSDNCYSKMSFVEKKK